MVHNKVYRLLERKDIKSKIIRSLEETKEKNGEHAFDFCSGQDITTTDIEEGSEYHIDIRNKCPVGTKSIGNFHTHAHLSLSGHDAIPSAGDMMESIERDLDFVCVSGNGRNGSAPIIRCFDKDNIKSEIDVVLTKKKLEPNEHNIHKSSRSITKRMMKDKDYLNKMSNLNR